MKNQNKNPNRKRREVVWIISCQKCGVKFQRASRFNKVCLECRHKIYRKNYLQDHDKTNEMSKVQKNNDVE
jgi:hypothetical protein